MARGPVPNRSGNVKVGAIPPGQLVRWRNDRVDAIWGPVFALPAWKRLEARVGHQLIKLLQAQQIIDVEVVRGRRRLIVPCFLEAVTPAFGPFSGSVEATFRAVGRSVRGA